MSSFYDDASLVVIPSGYKTSKIYAEKPTNGSGDLTFTRDSGATRVGPNGLIEKVRTNVLTYSQALTDASWSQVNIATATAGQTDPNGGTGATTFTGANGSNAIITKDFATTSGTPYTISIYIKGASSGTINFNHSGTTLAPQNTISYTTSWQRFTYSFVADSSTSTLFLGAFFSWDNGEQITFAFGQAETGDIATDYIPTTTAAVSVGPVINVPRLDYLGSSCPRLLLEPQRTNVVTFSEQFDNAAWTKSNATVTANTSVSPDGYTNADTVVITAGGYLYRELTSYSAVSGQSATISVFAKNQTNNFLIFGGATPAGTDVYKIENYGNGWYRHSVVRTFTTTTTGTLQYLVAYEIVGTHVIWGAQIEGSNSAYATSYIPTPGASSVTRVADAALKGGISSLIGQQEGVIYWEGILPSNTEGGSSLAANIISSDRNINSNSGYTINYVPSSQQITFSFFIGDGTFSPVVNLGNNLFAPGTYVKIAAAYKSGSSALVVNGGSPAVSTASFTSSTSISALWLNDVNVYFGYPTNLQTSAIAFFLTRLTNAQLAELTTL